MRPSWHEEATEEFCHSAAYYESKSDGLGDRFINEVEASIARILYDPEAIRIFSHGCRKMNLRRFPYSVIYTIREERVYVVAVMAHARKPGYWAERVK